MHVNGSRWCGAAIFVGAICACTPPPARMDTAPPGGGDVARAPEPAAPSEATPPLDPSHEEEPAGLGFAPGEIAVLDWTRAADKRSGRANLRLPSGELLSGRWTELDSRRGGGGKNDRIVATDPLADTGDSTTMPVAGAPARELIIDLTGERGTKVQCTLPLKSGLGGRGPTGVGTCRAPNGERFRVRLR
jgi:hypothetical protein